MSYRRPTREDIEQFIQMQEHETHARRELEEVRKTLQRERERYGPGYNPQYVLDKRRVH